MKYGTSLDGLSDLTGGIAESLAIKPKISDLLNIMLNLLKMTSIVLCKVDKDADNKDQQQSKLLTNGIVIGEFYRIYSIHKVRLIK